MDKNELIEFNKIGELLSYAIASHEAVILASKQGKFIKKDMEVFRLMMMNLLAQYTAYEYRNMSADDSFDER